MPKSELSDSSWPAYKAYAYPDQEETEEALVPKTFTELLQKQKKSVVMKSADMQRMEDVAMGKLYILERGGRRFFVPRDKFLEEHKKGGISQCRNCVGVWIDIREFNKDVKSLYYRVTRDQGLPCLRCMRRLIYKHIRAMSDSGISCKHSDEWMNGVGRTIGIEIECNPSLMSVVRAEKSRFANIKGDHSLRGHAIEFTSPILRETNFADWLSQFRENVKAHVYSRCGLHVWIGAPEFSWLDFVRFWQYCKLHEADFMSMVSRSRRPKSSDDKSGRPLCLPDPFLYRIRNKSDVLYILYGTRGESGQLRCEDSRSSLMVVDKRANDQSGTKYNGIVHRYHWVNLHSYWHRRAIEIRLHQGTTNRRKIAMWIRLWVDVMDHISRGGDIRTPPLAVTSPLVRSYYQQRIKHLCS